MKQIQPQRDRIGILWHPVDLQVGHQGLRPKAKPWEVTVYQSSWYWGSRISTGYCAFFRWQWQAKAVGWTYRRLLGRRCLIKQNPKLKRSA